MKTIILPVYCENEECGMQSAYEMDETGSYRKIMEGCDHYKNLPRREQIKAAIEKAEGKGADNEQSDSIYTRRI